MVYVYVCGVGVCGMVCVCGMGCVYDVVCLSGITNVWCVYMVYVYMWGVCMWGGVWM